MHHGLFYSRRPRERALRAAQRARFPRGQWAPREGVPRSTRHRGRTLFASSLIFLAYLKSLERRLPPATGVDPNEVMRSCEMAGLRLRPAVHWELDHGHWSQANEVTDRRRAEGPGTRAHHAEGTAAWRGPSSAFPGRSCLSAVVKVWARAS